MATASKASRPAAPFRVGEHVARRVGFDAAAIRRFATLSGDMNPLHHDDGAAAAGPFGTLIASGPHVAGLMMGLDATFFSERHEALGLGFEFRFVKAVPAGAELTLEWVVTDVTWKASLSGHVVGVEGRAVDDEGAVYLTATGRNLVLARRAAPRAVKPRAAGPRATRRG
ncbi:MAG TPA: MaoC family dehydratase, partial [Casimicrobiaceae bacterium]|nr:MaoC family dehydratase [Casimicrobiaceae bacterium]